MQATLMLSHNGNFVRKAHTENLHATVLDIYKRMGHNEYAQVLAAIFMDEVAEELCPVIENEDTGMMIEFIIH